MLADRSEMEIVLNNLLTNAVKYNHDGGRVTVRLAADAGRVTIEVTDTGIGLTAQEMDRLFREFVRIKNEKTRHVQGSGLGLSVLRRIAHLNGGEVTVRSVPGDGSTFTVEMAAAPPAAAGQAPAVATGAGAA
jgi:signal transduction histidine kinase